MAHAPAAGGISAARSIVVAPGAHYRLQTAWSPLAREPQRGLSEIVEQNQLPSTDTLPLIRSIRNAQSHQAFKGQYSHICRALLPLTFPGAVAAGKQAM